MLYDFFVISIFKSYDVIDAYTNDTTPINARVRVELMKLNKIILLFCKNNLDNYPLTIITTHLHDNNITVVAVTIDEL